MTILVIGSPNSGKSVFAEQLVMDMSKPDHRKYIATMIPFDQEGQDRIKKHRSQRMGKGFETLECPRDLAAIGNCQEDTLLLECLSNLVGNELYAEENQQKDLQELCQLICDEILELAARSENLVIVSNEFEKKEFLFMDEMTERYLYLTNRVNETLSHQVNQVFVKKEGAWVSEKII